MKRIFYVYVIGLMSLLAFSACDDKYSFAEGDGYMPRWFQANENDPSRLQILGPEWLVIDEIVKDDWKIIIQPKLIVTGRDSLKIETQKMPVNNGALMYCETNYDGQPIPVACGNLRVTYPYLGEEIQLSSFRGLFLSIKVIDSRDIPDYDFSLKDELEKTEEEGVETVVCQCGYVEYTLLDGSIPLCSVQQNFIVFDVNLY